MFCKRIWYILKYLSQKNKSAESLVKNGSSLLKLCFLLEMISLVLRNFPFDKTYSKILIEIVKDIRPKNCKKISWLRNKLKYVGRRTVCSREERSLTRLSDSWRTRRRRWRAQKWLETQFSRPNPADFSLSFHLLHGETATRQMPRSAIQIYLSASPNQ